MEKRWKGSFTLARYCRRSKISSKRRRITQQRLALIAQVSTPTISKFESGSEDIELSSVLRILHALGMADKRMLVFLEEEQKYDFNPKIIIFRGQDGEKEIICAISQVAFKMIIFKANLKKIGEK